MKTANPELQLADDFVQQTNCHIFLTGKAGTGKTTFLHDLKKKTHKRMVVTAPTGVAAINAGGVTLHSFFQMPFGPCVPGSEAFFSQHRFSRDKINIIKSLDLLVIDEISMVRADLLDGVDKVLRRYRRSSLPFGGVQLLMIGDLHQLSPVVKEAEWQILRQHYSSAYFFDSIALRETELIPVELKHIYRQADPHFIELLNRVRDNRLDAATLQTLNGRHLPGFVPPDDVGYITLCTHNSSADAINAAKLQMVQKKICRFEAEVDGDFPEHTYPTSGKLELKVGAQVMFVRNDSSPAKRYFNGKIGRITRISDADISIQCPDDENEIEVEPAVWENIEYTIDQETSEIIANKIGSFKQFPLKLAWAITIHKSQGLTFDRAIIDAGAAFTHGQVYVALSRCKTFEGMVLSSPLSAVTVRTDAAVLHFAEQASRNPPSAEKLAAAKIRYQQQLVLECFSFQDLRARLGRLLAILFKNGTLVQISAGVDLGALEKACREEVFSVSERFKAQLQGLFAAAVLPESDPVILERIGKASVYFEEKLDTHLVHFLADIQVDTDNKEIRKKIKEALKQLREETAVKIAAARSCRSGFSPAQYLRAVSVAEIELKPVKEKKHTVAALESDILHPDLFEILKQWRSQKAEAAKVPHFQIMHQKTLIQLAVNLPDNLADLEKIKGIGKRLAEKYGTELVGLVSAYRRQHGILEVETSPAAAPGERADKKKPEGKADTKKISLEMFEQNIAISEIARERGLVVSTVEGHLAFFVEKGVLAVERVVDTEKLQQIEQKLAEMPGNSFGEIKLALGDTCSYGEIKIVQAHLKYAEIKLMPKKLNEQSGG